MAKDLDLILSAANATSVVTPLAAFMRTQFAALAARGEIDQDLIAVAKVAQGLAGLGEPRDPRQAGQGSLEAQGFNPHIELRDSELR